MSSIKDFETTKLGFPTKGFTFNSELVSGNALPAIFNKRMSSIDSNTQVFDKRSIMKSPAHMTMMKTLNDKVFFDTKYKREIASNDEDMVKMKALLNKKRTEIANLNTDPLAFKE